MNKAPYATRGPRETLYVAMSAILTNWMWLELSEDKAVGIAMKATGGAADPRKVREEFLELKRERGIISPEPQSPEASSSPLSKLSLDDEGNKPV